MGKKLQLYSGVIPRKEPWKEEEFLLRKRTPEEREGDEGVQAACEDDLNLLYKCIKVLHNLIKERWWGQRKMLFSRLAIIPKILTCNSHGWFQGCSGLYGKYMQSSGREGVI